MISKIQFAKMRVFGMRQVRHLVTAIKSNSNSQRHLVKSKSATE